MNDRDKADTRTRQIYEARRQVAGILPQVGNGQEDLAYLYRSVEAYAHELRNMMRNDTTGREILQNELIGSITQEDIPAATVEKYSQPSRGSRGSNSRWGDLPKLPNDREVIVTIKGVNQFLNVGPIVAFNIIRPPDSRESGPQKEQVQIAVPRRLSVSAYDKLNTAMFSLGLDADAGENEEVGGNF